MRAIDKMESGRKIIPVEELYSKVVERLPRFDLVNR